MAQDYRIETLDDYYGLTLSANHHQAASWAFYAWEHMSQDASFTSRDGKVIRNPFHSPLDGTNEA